MRPIVVLVAVALLLSGCLSQEGTKAPPSSTDAPSPTSTPTPTGPIRPPPTWSNAMELSDCWRGGTVFLWPEQQGPDAPVPPGWESGFREAWEVYLLFYECERINVDDIERGPVRIAMEYHSKLSAPDACQEGDYDRLRILTRFYVNDPTLVEPLRERTQLPVELAEIGYERTLYEHIEDITWRLTPEGYGESNVRMATVWPEESAEFLFVWRLVWATDSGLHYMDLADLAITDNFQPSVTPGHMEAPLIMADSGIDPYVGRGGTENASEVSVRFFHFGDMECEEPE